MRRRSFFSRKKSEEISVLSPNMQIRIIHVQSQDSSNDPNANQRGSHCYRTTTTSSNSNLKYDKKHNSSYEYSEEENTILDRSLTTTSGSNSNNNQVGGSEGSLGILPYLKTPAGNSPLPSCCNAFDDTNHEDYISDDDDDDVVTLDTYYSYDSESTFSMETEMLQEAAAAAATHGDDTILDVLLAGILRRELCCYH